jgi:putative DNA primase/helicase
MRWNGHVWKDDNTLAAYDLVRRVCRERSAEANDPRVASALASAKTVAAVERLAKSDRRHAATTEQWDTDPWLLNTPGGTVDLRSGRLGPCRQDAYCTKSTAVAPDGGCPRWLAFLDQVTGGDQDMQAFLQRIAGYFLTGAISEQALFFAYGTGGNGKGIFINTLSEISGEYATTASADMFVVK